MRKAIILFVLAFAIAACDTWADLNEEEEQEAPTQAVDALRSDALRRQTALALTQQVPTQTAQAYETYLATIRPTDPPTLTPSPTPPDNVVTIAPTPTIFAELPNDELGNVYIEKSWLAEEFTATDGAVHTLEEFLGSTVILYVFDTSCESCIEQAQAIHTVAQEFHQEQRGYDIVYIALNIDESVSLRALNNWAERNEMPPTPEFDWMLANASTRLRGSLAGVFGDTSLDPETTTIIVVDVDGLSHLSQEGPMDQFRIVDVLVAYADPLIRETETAPTPE